jgi:hypothetical protein
VSPCRPARPRPPKVVVAIDQAVPRRPPAMRARADAKEGPGTHCLPHHPTRLNPGLLIQEAFYDTPML